MTKRDGLNPRERLRQLYRDLRTARLNDHYYGRKLTVWSRIIGTHDVLLAFGTAASPIAFWKNSRQPGEHATWIALSLVTFVLGALKPTLRLQDRLKTLSELQTQYRELFFNLQELGREVAAHEGYTSEVDKQYFILRKSFAKLEAKDGWEPDFALIAKLQKRVNREIPPESLWMPSDQGM